MCVCLVCLYVAAQIRIESEWVRGISGGRCTIFFLQCRVDDWTNVNCAQLRESAVIECSLSWSMNYNFFLRLKN